MLTKVISVYELFDDWYIKENLSGGYTINTEKQIGHYHEYHEKRYQALCDQLKNYPENIKQTKDFIFGINKNMDHNHPIKSALDDPENFFSQLQKTNVTSKIINAEEEKISQSMLISKYNDFGRLLVPSKSRKEQNKFLYELANTFFFFAYDQKTFPVFKKFILNDNYHPFARFIYSIIWIHLARNGWSTWHNQCIQNLQKINQHKEIVYCAGGTDIFHLLKNKIYNFRIIDPYLPTQKKFYAKNWRFFLNGSSGDQILCQFDHRTLTLKRTNTLKKGTFSLYNKKLISFLTTWEVFHEKSTQPCGTITFERRPLQQKDFDLNNEKVLLISFNELYFITRTVDNWGIKLSQLPKDFKLFVKQLKQPLDKQTLLNMRKADEIETLEFIQLGSNID